MTDTSERLESGDFEAWERIFLETNHRFPDRAEIWQAARRAPAAGAPEGWKLVPVEPTDEMQDAAGESVYGYSRYQAEEWGKSEKFESSAYVGVEAYRAMLAAAPNHEVK